MGYINGMDRSQTMMFPERLDDYVSKDSYVRFLDQFVDSFDLSRLGFRRSVPADTGRPAYDPRDILKLYLFGFMNRLTTSRQLAYACQSNIEVMWLLRRVQPDFRTISDFRKENRESIRMLFRRFVRRLKAMGLVRGELVAIDGTKFQAVNSKDNNFSEKKLRRLIRHYDQRIQHYLERLEKNDTKEADASPLREQLQQQLQLAQQRRQEKVGLLNQLQESGEKQLSSVDPDSKRMKSGDGTVVGYNVQATVDAEHKLIVDVEVTSDGNDSQQLLKMTTRAKEILQQDHLKAAADTGYYRAEEIAECEKSGVETYISKPRAAERKLYAKTDFIYHSDENYYICPAGQRLDYRGKIREHGRWLLRYEGNCCSDCPLRSQCSSRKNGNRRVTRFIDEDLLESVEERSKNSPEIRTLRKSIVEHPFGSLKRLTGGRFYTRGRLKAGTEIVLAAIAYDLKRLVNIFRKPSGSQAYTWSPVLPAFA